MVSVPQHQYKDWQRLIDDAVAAGWHVSKTKAHPKFVLECPGGSPRCRFTIPGTPNSYGVALRAARSALSRCNHLPTEPLAEVDRLLDEAQTHVDLAERYRALERASAEVDEHLRYAEDVLEAAEEMVDHEAFGRAVDDQAALRDELGLDEQDVVPDASETAQRARAPLSTAEKILRPLPTRAEDVKDRRERLKNLRQRMRILSQ